MANEGLESEHQRDPGAEGQSPLKLKAFYPFSYKRGAKVKDLNETIQTKIRTFVIDNNTYSRASAVNEIA